MAEQRFLVVRLGSLGDIVHALPAVADLRAAFPQARIDWIVEPRWLPLLEGNSDITEVIPFDRRSSRSVSTGVKRLRNKGYTCAVDFQGLYKSALLAWLSGAPRRIGFRRTLAREGGASFFYNVRVAPAGRHIVELNRGLAQAAGATLGPCRFPLAVSPDAEAQFDELLRGQGLQDSEFFMLSPGGGWRSKCWPPERYGELHGILARRYGWRGWVNFGPDEQQLAEAVARAAGEPPPVVAPLALPTLMAAMRRAKFVVAGDTGPLHLAVALGTLVVGLYGPTDPIRNGPFGAHDIVVRNARPEETTYARRDAYSPAMLAIPVEQVVEAVERRLDLER